MSTVYMTGNMFRTEIDVRVNLGSFRSTFRDVDNFTMKEFSLTPGNSEEFIAEMFFHVSIQTPVDLMSIQVGANILQIPNAVGMFSLPMACSISLEVPSDSENSLPRLVKVWYN